METIKKRKDFVNLRTKGSFIKPLPWLYMSYIRNKNGNNRFACSISTKVEKKAVVRNRIKRWFRAEFREKKYFRGLDVHFIFRKKEKAFYQSMPFQILDIILKNLVAFCIKILKKILVLIIYSINLPAPFIICLVVVVFIHLAQIMLLKV